VLANIFVTFYLANQRSLEFASVILATEYSQLRDNLLDGKGSLVRQPMPADRTVLAFLVKLAMAFTTQDVVIFAAENWRFPDRAQAHRALQSLHYFHQHVIGILLSRHFAAFDSNPGYGSTWRLISDLDADS